MGLPRSPILSNLPGLNAEAKDRIHAEYERAIELWLVGTGAAWQEFCETEKRARVGAATLIDRHNALQSAQHAELRATVAAHRLLFDAIVLEYSSIVGERHGYGEPPYVLEFLAVRASLPCQDTNRAVHELILARATLGIEPIRPIAAPKRTKRGRPALPEHLKRQALEKKSARGTNSECAKILYQTSRPTAQQVKNVTGILKHYRKTALGGSP